MAPAETCRSAWPDQDEPRISYGLPFPETCQKHVDNEFKASRVYILCSGTLARNTSNFSDLQSALGKKVAGTRIGLKPHTFMSEVLEIVHDARKVNADLIVTLGGGSLTDAGKLTAMALGNNVQTEDDLMKLPHMTNPDVEAKQPKFPIICIPTTLSAGEYSDYSGVTRDRDHQKFQFSPPLKGPRLIILDANLAVATPINVWIASGVRAVDHCIESFCSLKRDTDCDEASVKGLQCMVPGLLKCAADPSDAVARHECQIGANYSMTFVHKHVPGGASHGIGHMLGPLGVAHGETSCVLMPAVAKYNAKYEGNIERQRLVKKVLWDLDVAKERFQARGLHEETADLGDLIDAIFRELQMPRSLREVGVGRDKFDGIAINSLEDYMCKNNPVPLVKKEQVLEILEMCA